MRLFNKVAIIGVGLIGGSIALALKRRRLANRIIGVSRHKATILLAKKNRAIDEGSQHLGIIKDADLVILATPVNTILNLAGKIQKIIRKDCIVSDCGSTKVKIVSKLDRLFPNYVGSHPLAGSEKRGIVNARSNIFKNSLCVITPTKNTKYKAQEKIRKMWAQLGVKVAFLSPDTHDKILSFVSHLPHIVAFTLINSPPQKYLKFAASGLKDTTRIAVSDSELWADIFLSNQKNLLKSIELFQGNLLKIKSAIKQRDRRTLITILKEAKKKRETLG